METHQTFGERLDGHKTYLTAIGFAALAAYKFWGHRWEDGAEMMLVALATASLRHAIARKVIAPQGANFLEDHD
jgi:hypothetical protein